jgi:hypothetical protein
MASVKVNPPPFLRLPKAFIDDREVRAFIEQQNTILFQLWRKTGGNSDLTINSTTIVNSGYSSQIQFLQQQLNGLPEFTIDTSGFTTDLTFITTDKVIA